MNLAVFPSVRICFSSFTFRRSSPHIYLIDSSIAAKYCDIKFHLNPCLIHQTKTSFHGDAIEVMNLTIVKGFT